MPEATSRLTTCLSKKEEAEGREDKDEDEEDTKAKDEFGKALTNILSRAGGFSPRRNV